MSMATLPPPKATAVPGITIDQFLAQYGECPADLVKGKIVEYAMPGVKHGKVCVKAAGIIDSFVTEHQLGHVVSNDTHVLIRRNPDTARGMDVGYVSYTRLPKETVPDGALTMVPELVFEVRSPTDRWVQILGKVFDYLDLGVSAVVVLDPKTTSATVFRAEDRQQTINADETLTLPDILPGFSVVVGKFFE